MRMILVSLALVASTVACGTTPAVRASGPAGKIAAVGAENEYADVISQVGGRYVEVRAVMSNPDIDPHDFEASASVAREVGQAQLIVQNGLGYDSFMSRIEAATTDPARHVIVVQKLLGLPDSTPNPHLWYEPSTMPKVAREIAGTLAKIQPAHAEYFQSRATAFVDSLSTVDAMIAKLRKDFAATPVAVSEPVADGLLSAAGFHILTPWSFQADVMNGVDPAPQDVSLERSLLVNRKVKVFVYNRQVTDTLTSSLLDLARNHRIAIVGVYETMPTPGFDYQSWMMAEVAALRDAIAHGISAPSL